MQSYKLQPEMNLQMRQPAKNTDELSFEMSISNFNSLQDTGI
jgi:hypothetical protein